MHNWAVSPKCTDVKKGRTPDHATQEPVRAPGTRLKSPCFIRGHARHALHPRGVYQSSRRSLLAPCTQITSAANQTSILASSALRDSGDPARTSRRCGCTAQISTDGRTCLVYKYHTCREDSSSSPPQPVRDGDFQQPDVHMLSVEVDMVSECKECEFGPAAWPSKSNSLYSPVANNADRRLDRFLAPYISVAGVMIDHKYRVIYSDWGGSVACTSTDPPAASGHECSCFT